MPQPHILVNEIMEAYEKRAELAGKIKQFTKLDAANKIAQHLLGLA